MSAIETDKRPRLLSFVCTIFYLNACFLLPWSQKFFFTFQPLIFFSGRRPRKHKPCSLRKGFQFVARWYFVLFHSKRLKPYKSLNLKIDGVNIQEVSTVKYLGVTFDSNLTWKNHVNELCLKLSKTVGIFSKLRYYVNVDILIMLYYSLIYPLLSYGIQVWGSHTQPT